MGDRSQIFRRFPNSVAADTSDYDAGEEPDPWAAGAGAPEDWLFPYSVAAFWSIYDGKENDSWGTGAGALGDFPDSVAADSPDCDAGEEPDPSAARARAPWDL